MALLSYLKDNLELLVTSNYAIFYGTCIISEFLTAAFSPACWIFLTFLFLKIPAGIFMFRAYIFLSRISLTIRPSGLIDN